jgi:hypothetical protein
MRKPPSLQPVCGDISSSVDGTFIWMKSFHITVSEGTGDLDPVRRSVSGHPLRRGIFFGEICSSGSAPQARPNRSKNAQSRPTTRPWFLLSKPLSSSHPTPLRHKHCDDLPLSSLSAYVFEKRSCSSVPGPDPGRGLEASDATKRNFRWGPPLKKFQHRPNSTRKPPRRTHARKANRVGTGLLPTHQFGGVVHSVFDVADDQPHYKQITFHGCKCQLGPNN